MNEEEIKAFTESGMSHDYWDSYQKEEEINKSLYNDIYEEVMESGMDNEKNPKMFSVARPAEARDPDNLSDDIMIFTFALQGDKIPDIFCNGSLWTHSFTTIEEARDFYVRLRNSGYKEHTEPVNGVYAYYRDQRNRQNLQNIRGDYALNA